MSSSNAQPSEYRVLHLRSSGGMLGTERVILEIARHSRTFGYNSIVGLIVDEEVEGKGCMPPQLSEEAKACGVEVALFPCRGRLDFRTMRLIRHFVKEQNIDLIHAHGYKEDLYALCSFSGVPLVATNHLWKEVSLPLRIYSWIDVVCLHFFRHIVAVSSQIMEEMVRRGLKKERMEMIANGIDLYRFETEVNAKSLRDSLGIDEHALVVGMVSSLTPEKGHAFALEAFPGILEKFPQALLLIVGEGRERTRIEDTIEQRGIKDRVILAGARTDIPQILQILDVFLLPSLAEGLPIALLEAMAASKPAVASGVGEVPSVIEDGVSGLVIKPGDIHGLSSSVIRLLDNPELRRLYGHQAREAVKSSFSAEAMTAKYCKVYARVLSQGLA